MYYCSPDSTELRTTRRFVSRIRQTLPLLFDMVTPMPYVALQTMFDEAAAWGSYAYEKTGYVADLSDPVIEAVTEHMPPKTPLCQACCPTRLRGLQPGRRRGHRVCRRTLTAVQRVHRRHCAPAVLLAERTWAQELLGGVAAARHRRRSGGLRQRPERVGEDRLRAAYSSAKYNRLDRSRPSTTGERLPPQRQHQAGLTSGRLCSQFTTAV
jgi:hypothetical protein